MTFSAATVEELAAREACEACRQSTTGYCYQHAPGVTVSTIPFTITPFSPIVPQGSQVVWTGFFVPQGWQCPCCRRVYAPFMSMCPSCPGPVSSVITTTTSEPHNG
jgi:hypothetical protein